MNKKMAYVQNEYTRPTSGGPPCNYTTLCAYNMGAQMAPMPHAAKTVVGKQVVPAYNAIGYDALTHGGCGSCAGYFNINGAYGTGAGQCNQSYVTTLCGGCGQYGGGGRPLAPLTPGRHPLAPLTPGGHPLAPLTPGGHPLAPLSPS